MKQGTHLEVLEVIPNWDDRGSEAIKFKTPLDDYWGVRLANRFDKVFTFKDFESVVDFSADFQGETKNFNADFTFRHVGNEYKCHSVNVSNRNFTLNCDEGYFEYLVDSYGDDNISELFDWEISNDNN